MGFLNYLLYPWGFILQGLAIVHFIRRRPDTYWIFIILFLGPLGAIIYLLLEAAPDLGLLRQSFKFFPRRRRMREAREWAQRILDKKPTMPGYLRRRERPWFRRAAALLKRLPA